MSTHSSSPARIAANQANAQHSTGPKTAEGKSKASLNAVTTALTGRTVLLAQEDVTLYEKHLAGYHHQFQPSTEVECVLVQAIADTEWRLGRIPHLILALEAKARIELADTYNHLDAAERGVQIELEAFLKYEKQLRNLQLQESRLHRRREKDMAELRTLQRERDSRRAQELAVAAKLYLAAQHENQPFDPADLGFDFSIVDVESYLKDQRANAIPKHPVFGSETAPASA